MYAIEKVESGGNNNKTGASGEITSMQFLPKTYQNYSKLVLGYVAIPSKINAEYIAARMIQQWMSKGKTIHQVSLAWNAGEGAMKCGKGINAKGVNYDSCAYVNLVAANY